MAYESNYTGEQVDAAIEAAQNAIQMPDGGSTGDVLTKTEDGVEWAQAGAGGILYKTVSATTDEYGNYIIPIDCSDADGKTIIVDAVINIKVFDEYTAELIYKNAPSGAKFNAIVRIRNTYRNNAGGHWEYQPANVNLGARTVTLNYDESVEINVAGVVSAGGTLTLYNLDCAGTISKYGSDRFKPTSAESVVAYAMHSSGSNCVVNNSTIYLAVSDNGFDILTATIPENSAYSTFHFTTTSHAGNAAGRLVCKNNKTEAIALSFGSGAKKNFEGDTYTIEAGGEVLIDYFIPSDYNYPSIFTVIELQ